MTPRSGSAPRARPARWIATWMLAVAACLVLDAEAPAAPRDGRAAQRLVPARIDGPSASGCARAAARTLPDRLGLAR